MALRRITGRAVSLPAGMAFGAGISIAITLTGAAGLAKMLDLGKIQWMNVGYGIMIIILLSSFLGAVCAYHRVKSKRILVCSLSGVIYLVLLLSATALFFGGQYEAVGVTSALILAGSGTAVLLGMREKRGGNRRKRKGYSC